MQNEVTGGAYLENHFAIDETIAVRLQVVGEAETWRRFRWQTLDNEIRVGRIDEPDVAVESRHQPLCQASL